MANEFKVKHGLIVNGNITNTGEVITPSISADYIKVNQIDITNLEIQGYTVSGDLVVSDNLTVNTSISSPSISADYIKVNQIDITNLEIQGYTVSGDLMVSDNLTVNTSISSNNISTKGLLLQAENNQQQYTFLPGLTIFNVSENMQVSAFPTNGKKSFNPEAADKIYVYLGGGSFESFYLNGNEQWVSEATDLPKNFILRIDDHTLYYNQAETSVTVLLTSNLTTPHHIINRSDNFARIDYYLKGLLPENRYKEISIKGNNLDFNNISADNLFVSTVNIKGDLQVDNISLQDQLLFNSSSTTQTSTQLSSLSGNYDEGFFIGGIKISQNNARLINIGNTWTPKESNRFWQSVAMSSDGKYQTAVVSGGGTYSQIYISNSYGNTWTAKESDRDWYSIAMSSDGKYQTAVVYNGQIYISSDYGNTWTAKESNRYWNSVAMNSNGKYQTATVNDPIVGNKIYISSDYGNTWVAKESNRYWSSVAISSDGKYQTAVVYNGQIYISSDYGNTWVAKESDRDWYSIAMSSDGKYQTAVVYNGQIYISGDYGNTWVAKESNRTWYSIAMSSDGKYQTAVVYNGQIYISSDYGNTWIPKESNRIWYSIAMSSDSKYQTAVVYNGQIYISKADELIDGNLTVTNSISSPSISADYIKVNKIDITNLEIQGYTVSGDLVVSDNLTVNTSISTPNISVSSITADDITFNNYIADPSNVALPTNLYLTLTVGGSAFGIPLSKLPFTLTTPIGEYTVP